MKWCRSGKVRNVHYLKPDRDWTKPDGRLVERYYFTDFLHLVEEGYEKFANSIYEAIVKVLQGNAVGFGTEESENELNKTKEIENKKKGEKQWKTWLRTANNPEANLDQQHYHPKHNRNRTDKQHQRHLETTVLPKPIPTTTLPPSTAIASKLKIPPTVTSTLIPTIPPTTTSTLIMTTQPTATLPLTPTIPLTATLTQIPTMPPTTTLPHIQTTTLTLPPRALTTTLPPTTTIPPSLRPTTILTPKHLHKCNRPINTLTRTSTVSPKPNPPARTPPTTTIPPIQTQNSTLPTDNITLNNLTTLFMNFLSLFILLLIPFTILCLTNNVDFNVELRDCKQSFLYHKRNLYITNIFNYF